MFLEKVYAGLPFRVCLPFVREGKVRDVEGMLSLAS